MSSVRPIEAHGPDVEAAIEAGLQELGLSRSDVIVEVVEEGRKGILGLGSKDATVRLTPLTAHTEPQVHGAAAEESTPRAGEPQKPEKAPIVAEQKPVSGGQVTPSPRPTPEASAAGDEELESIVTEIVSNLLLKMGFGEATISVDRSEPDDQSGRVMTIVRVDGDNLAGLIGPHGETLNDFQYVARLMAGHALRRRADFIVDIDGYRSQRKESLSSLARRMAQKAVERGSPVTLEPMSSYDRRIIHMALRDRDDVYTSSVGEGSNRRVRVFLKDGDEA